MKIESDLNYCYLTGSKEELISADDKAAGLPCIYKGEEARVFNVKAMASVKLLLGL